MHRFGRSAQQKLKDRWGGSFILATILALVGAWFAGSWLNDSLKGETAGTDTNPPGVVSDPINNMGGGNNTVTQAPSDFNLYLVQVGAFRSEASAHKLANDLIAQGYNAAVAPRKDGLVKVYAGLHTMPEAAQETRDRAIADGMTQAWTVTIPVTNTADTVPVMAGLGKNADLKKGLEAMNAYLYEAALWMENQIGTTGGIAANGEYLRKLAMELKKAAGTNPLVEPYANLAGAAGTNAADIQTAAQTAPGSVEYHKAANGYMALLEQYRSLAMAAGN